MLEAFIEFFKQVAEDCGFANTRRLCEIFKRLEGVTPEQYRRQREQGLETGRKL